MASQRTLIPKWIPPNSPKIDKSLFGATNRTYIISPTSDEVVMLALWRNGGSTKRTARELGMTRPDIRLIRRKAYEQMGVKTAHEYWRAKGLDPVSPREQRQGHDKWRWRHG